MDDSLIMAQIAAAVCIGTLAGSLISGLIKTFGSFLKDFILGVFKIAERGKNGKIN